MLGYHGKVNGGVYQVGVPRAETVIADDALKLARGLRPRWGI